MDKHAPRKKNWISSNTKPHGNEKLRSAIMKRSGLKNTANKTKSRNDIINYKKQRNLAVKLNKKSKYKYFYKYDPNKQTKPKR